jgi:hypothetical protein
MSTKQAILSTGRHEVLVPVDEAIIEFWRARGHQGPPDNEATLIVPGLDWTNTTISPDETHWYAVDYNGRYRTYFVPPAMNPDTDVLVVYFGGSESLDGTSEPGTGDSEAHGDATGTSDSGPYESYTPFNPTSSSEAIDFFLVASKNRVGITVASYVFGIRF